MHPPCTLYVVECVTPKTWYVGTTTRQKHKRFQEHFDGVACKWTMRHGCKRIALSFPVPMNKASEMGQYSHLVAPRRVWRHQARRLGFH
jgi:predicted GIY-YIG superfamily endonuclease